MTGHLVIAGVPSDEVKDLRKLSIYLKKNGPLTFESSTRNSFIRALHGTGYRAGHGGRMEAGKGIQLRQFPGKRLL